MVPQIVMSWTLEAETSVAFRRVDAELAARLREEVGIYSGHMLGGDTALLGCGEYLIGRVAIVEQRYDDAIAAMTKAVEYAHERALHHLATNHRVDLARALLGRAGTADADQARALLTEAIETADALGLAPAAREARSLVA